ncbi:2Fe-2S iron-sulfur cluster-binding protein [Niveispirillum fermenti]|uniref:2Fe-2S iron-sulfur cluster-binding protein n=1 Tax=Niveispirillum fermenti TaxID=1233113 RepID=UPI003A8549EB
MPTVTVTTPHEGTRRVELQTGTSLMEGLKDAGIDIAAICGGACSCATCHVHLDPARMADLPPAGPEEQELLGDLDDYRPDRSRLSCQIPVTDALDGLSLSLAP